MSPPVDYSAALSEWSKVRNTGLPAPTALMQEQTAPHLFYQNSAGQNSGFDFAENKENPVNPNTLSMNAPLGFYNDEKGILGNFFGSTNKAGHGFTGWGMPTINMATGLANTYTGWKNMETQRDALDFQKQAFSDQFNMQKKLTNAELRDRQTRRVAANPNAMSVNEYMKQNGL